MRKLPGLARAMRNGKPPQAVYALISLLIATALSGASCSSANRDEHSTPVFRSAELPEVDLRLLVVTDLTGHLEPCGCTSRPLGGVDRLAAAVEEARRRETPTLFVAAGDLFFSENHDSADVEGASTQEIWKAETLAALLNRMGLDAAAPGVLDLTYGETQLETLANEADFPLLGVPGEPTAVLREVRGTKVGIVAAAQLRSSEETDAILERARRDAAEMRADGADFVVVLARLPRREVRRLASVPEIDFVVLGGVDDAEPHLPSASEAVIIHASHQGQGLVVVDAMKRETGAWSDLSDWTRRAALESANEDIARLRERITQWESDSDVRPADLAGQRERLAALERERTTLAEPPSIGARAFSARFIELDSNKPRDPVVSQAMESYFERVNDHNRVAFESDLPEPVPDGQPRYVGSEACASCHQEAYTWWRSTPHGHAYRTLQEVHKEYNLSCVGCHVTGYRQPGGSTVSHVGALADVGCENCHGPGSAHIEAPEAMRLSSETPESTCVRCHNSEHSDRFVYRSYLPLLRAPGHGSPSTTSSDGIAP